MRTSSKPPLTDELGFRHGAGGVHTSRTMMLAELIQVLDRVPTDAPAGRYLAEIVEENVLGKPTRSTRQRTARRLTELYALDPRCPLFRLLRFYWSDGAGSRPMLAFLLACARDALLRKCTPRVLGTARDQVVAPAEIATWIGEEHPGRFRATTERSAAQNLASSWAQAGLLRGVVVKRRSQPVVTPAVVAYALLLGHLGGLRGQRLLDSTWTNLLDLPRAAIVDSAMEASKHGWLCYKMAGPVVEVTFPSLLTPAEERTCREQD